MKIFHLYLILCGIAWLYTDLFAKEYIVAKSGGDFSTLQDAANAVQPGDIVYVRAGTYLEYVEFTIPGTLSQPITFQVYSDERVIIDGSSRPPNPENPNSELPVVQILTDFYILRGLEVTKSANDGIRIVGNDNIIDNVKVYNNYKNGLKIFGSRNTISNVMSFKNNGFPESSDGISISSGSNNVIQYCDLYANGDDGIDLWESTNNLLEYNFSHDNGVPPTGDGNGFKLGPGGNNIVRFNVAYNNLTRGFDNNFGDNNQLYNNTAYNNNNNDFSHRRNSDIQYVGDTYKNNISFGNHINLNGTNISENNSWDLNIDDPNFISVDSSSSDFLRLDSVSPAIDAGVDVGLPFEGLAPDLGAFEFTAKNELQPTIDASPNSGQVPLSVIFNGSVSGGTSPYTYYWDFDDGLTFSGQNPPPHTYAQIGEYLAKLIVTDSNGVVGTDSVTISVVEQETFVYIYLEGEDFDITSPMQVGIDNDASASAYIYTPPGTGNASSPVAEASYQINLANGGIYYLWLCTYAPSTNNDATYIGFDGSYERIYPLNTNRYEWVKVGDSHNLDAETNELNIGHGEEQARVDRIFITNDPNVIPEAADSLSTATITLSDPSPTKAGSVEVTLTTSKNIASTPTDLIFTESDSTIKEIILDGPVPGNTFTGVFMVDSTVSDGPGKFSLSGDTFEIISGAGVKIDKTPPSKPLNIRASFE